MKTQDYAKSHQLLALVTAFIVGGILIGSISLVVAKNNQQKPSNSSQGSSTSSSTSANLKVTDGSSDLSLIKQPDGNSSTGSTPSSISGSSIPKQSTQSSNGSQQTPTPSTPGPTTKQPTTQYFISGTVTPVLALNQAPNGYSVWSNYSSAFNATGYNKVKVSWFIDNTADPSIEIQISYDGSSWTTYKSAVNSGRKTGSLSFDLPAPYIRIFMNNGSCVPSYCENPRPSWAQPYTSTVSGYFSL